MSSPGDFSVTTPSFVYATCIAWFPDPLLVRVWEPGYMNKIALVLPHGSGMKWPELHALKLSTVTAALGVLHSY